MKFPTYVPEVIQQQATHYLEGHTSCDESWDGWIACLEKQKVELACIDEKIAYWKHHTQDTDYAEYQLNKLRKDRLDVIQHINHLEKDINCITRLVHDASMMNAYKLLLNEFFGSEDADRKIDQFIQFAWAANINYAEPREAVNRAKGHTKEISATAAKLASLLNELGETGSNCPGEFFSIPALLESTDSNHGHDFHIWQSMKNVVLGNSPIRKESSISIDVAAPFDPTEQARNALRYGWEKAPYLSELLNTVAKVADEFKPNCGYFADTAISSRQRSCKTEYIRGYADLLKNAGIHFSPTIINAIAITATVVINNPDLIVTYDDVRKAPALTA